MTIPLLIYSLNAVIILLVAYYVLFCPTNSLEASNNDLNPQNDKYHESDPKMAIIGVISHEDLKCNYTPLTKDLNNIVKIDSIYLLREYFLLRPEFTFRELIDRMPFFYNVKTKEICEMKKLDKIFRE